MPVAEAQRRISSAEFAEWLAFASVYPFGEMRADLRAGLLAATLANIHRDARKTPRVFRPMDFVPLIRRDDPQPEMAPSLSARLKAAFATFKRAG